MVGKGKLAKTLISLIFHQTMINPKGKTLLPRNTSGLVANDVASASHLRDIEENRHQLDPIGFRVHSLN